MSTRRLDVAAGRSNRGRRRASKTRQRLLHAALRQFGDKGVDATTVEEITERADVGKGTFYLHFDNKEGALVALVEQAVDDLIERMKPSTPGNGGLEHTLAHLLAAHERFFEQDNEQFLLLFQGRAMLQMRRDPLEELECPYLRYLDAIGAQLAPFLPHAVDPLKLRRLACALAGFVSGFFSFAMIGMASTEIETNLKPLREAFVGVAVTFLRA